ncbi:MAG TPA: beta-ketoacyl-ACP synthase III [Candidatus Dormibacteraeota bacterium]|nr:beta-ketoacyl-ACP synthase III [Candidatus Dormibacteraeota bacterium]
MSVTPLRPAAAVHADGALRRAAAPGILGIGAFTPAGRLTNADLEAMVDTSDTWILERTGIRERRRGDATETSSVMGARAAAQALARAGNPEVDLVLTATASPDTLFPSTACLIQRRLGIGGIPAFDLSAACSGFVYALTLAESLIATGRNRRILVVAAESMTSLVDFKDRGTCVLFGDGAGAAVVGVDETGRGGLRAASWGADGGESDLIYFGPPSDGSEGPDAVRMHGKGTFRLAVERMAETAERLCAQAGWAVGDVDHVVPHQANLRIIDAVAKRLGLRPEQLVVNGDMYGNTSAASIPIALAEADATGRLHAGDRVLCVAFGAGLTWGGVALEWSLDPRDGRDGA